MNLPINSDGSGHSDGWEVVEEESFERALAQFRGGKLVDAALAPIDYGLNRDPQGFPQVPGYIDMYFARTKIRFLGPELIPSYRLWFRVDAKSRTVFKLWVELTPPDELGYVDEDDLPF